MGKYEKKKEKKRKSKVKIVVIVLILVIALAVLGLFVMPQVLYQINNQGTDISTGEKLAGATEPQIVYSADDELIFPVELEEGALEIESLFPFSGINPDADMQETEDVASITLKNTSNRYLKTAAITAILGDGTECIFTVTDLPAGASVIAFATSNESLTQDAFCVGISSDVVFEDIQSWDQLSVSMVGMTVTLQNISDEDFSQIDVYCRDVFGESYFGGITYKYTINELSAGQSATIEVTDSLLGLIDVVRIAINE